MNRSALAAAAAAALALSACQYMPWEHQQPHAAGQTSATPTTSPALAPDLVRDIQTDLNQKGYNVGQVDGVFGDSTQSALERFQRDQHLHATGQVDQQTLAALGIGGASGPGYVPTARRQSSAAPEASGIAAPGQKVSPGMVSSIQQQLNDRGYKVGQVDGVWGPRTRQALAAFQHDQNIPGRGRIDQQTLAALNLGGGQANQQTGQLPPPHPTQQ